ncbi:MAG: sugar ABC transporter substrate-binding protein [Balneolales bacterium]
MKKFLIILLSSILLPVFWGCNREQYSGEPTVALVVKTLNNPFFMEMQRGAEDAAKELELNLVIQAAEREVDVEQQMQIIENLIQRKVDVIAVTPSGSRELIPVISRANQANIPVIIVDTRLDEKLLKSDGAQISTFIGSDNFEGGRLAGIYIGERLNGSGKVAILEGIPGHETGDSRRLGFLKGLEESPDIQIVTSQTANWERSLGYNVFENILQSYSDVQAVFAANDLMALGALEALSSNREAENEVIVVGFDAHEEAIEAIRNGAMAATIAQHPYEMGRMAVENASRILKGEEVPDEIPVQIELITKASLPDL